MRELGKYGVAGYLKKRVKACGGTVEAFKSPGRANVPDWLVTWPDFDAIGEFDAIGLEARMDLVETKAPGKKPRDGQVRDHARRAAMGISVWVLDCKESVDAYVEHRLRYY